MKKIIKIFIVTIIVTVCLISIPFNLINLIKDKYYINIDENEAKLVNSLINDNNLTEKPIEKLGYMGGLGDWYLFIEYKDGEKIETLYNDVDNLELKRYIIDNGYSVGEIAKIELILAIMIIILCCIYEVIKLLRLLLKDKKEA